MKTPHEAEPTNGAAKAVVGCAALGVGGMFLLLAALWVIPSLLWPGDDELFEGDEIEYLDEEVEFGDEEAEFIREEQPWGNYDSKAVDFADMPTPTYEARLADLGNNRIREIEFFLQEGDTEISFAVRNPEPIRIDGQGIAVRTDDFARILHSSRPFTTSRPVECVDGNCRLFMWLTMGPTFLEWHPDAELLIWAGEGAAVTIEPMPMDNIRAETFR